MTKVETRRFRLFKLLLSIDVQWVAIVVGLLYLPVMIFMPDKLLLLLLFLGCLAFLMWLASIPRFNRREDGAIYPMDGKERAEKYFIEKGWWMYE